MTKHGFDVSYAQGNIDWKSLKNDKSNPYFVIIRDGFSLTLDKKFERNVKEALSNGFKIPGIYHFSYALSVKDAEDEAEFAVKNAKKVSLPKETIIFFDFEYDSEGWCKEKGVNPTPEFVQSVTKAFCEKVRALGYTPGVYTNVDYYERLYKKKIVPEDAVVWAAKWAKTPPYFKHTFWQTGYSSGFAGVNGDIDTDIWECEDDSKPEPETKKTNEEIADEVIRGDWGNGEERKTRLTEAGYDYDAVQDIVNDKLYSKTNEEIADEVIRGDWGNGVERKERLEAAGYDYDAVQDIVNKKLYGE